MHQAGASPQAAKNLWPTKLKTTSGSPCMYLFSHLNCVQSRVPHHLASCSCNKTRPNAAPHPGLKVLRNWPPWPTSLILCFPTSPQLPSSITNLPPPPAVAFLAQSLLLLSSASCPSFESTYFSIALSYSASFSSTTSFALPPRSQATFWP